MKELGFGIMGPGYIAHQFAEAVIENDGAFLAGVASKSLDRALEFAQKYNIPAAYSNYELLSGDKNVDVVYISTTNNYHYENILTCIANGKHVICEKPMVMTKNQAEDVFSKAEEKGVFVMEAMWSRFLPPIIKARELITSGAIGEVKHIVSSLNSCQQYNPEERIFNKALGGGVLYDLGVYNLSLSMLLAGEKPVSCHGYCNISSEGTDTFDTVIMRFPSGVTASFTCGVEASNPNEMNIFGTKGSIKLYDRFIDSSRIDLIIEDKQTETFNFAFGNGFTFEVQEVINCINSCKLQSEVVSWQDTLDCAEVTEKLLTDWGVMKGGK